MTLTNTETGPAGIPGGMSTSTELVVTPRGTVVALPKLTTLLANIELKPLPWMVRWVPAGPKAGETESRTAGPSGFPLVTWKSAGSLPPKAFEIVIATKPGTKLAGTATATVWPWT